MNRIVRMVLFICFASVGAVLYILGIIFSLTQNETMFWTYVSFLLFGAISIFLGMYFRPTKKKEDAKKQELKTK